MAVPFAPGRTYAIGVTAHLGTPHAGSGDFDQRQYPAGYSQSWSSTFTVTP